VNPTTEQGRNERETATDRLLRAYHQDGDSRVRDRIVTLYLPVVATFAHGYARPGVEYGELVEAGSSGLVKAIKRFDPRRDDDFAASAVRHVVDEIKRHIGDRNGLTALSDEGHDEPGESTGRVLSGGVFHVLDADERLLVYLRFVRDVGPGEVAAKLGITQPQLARRAQDALAKLRSELERVGSGAPDQQPSALEPAEPPRRQAKRKDSPSGRLLLRMPQSLHAGLAEAAEREGVSLNQFITNSLAAAVAWRQPEREQPKAERQPG
jgi:RNA polymerase sigma factor (sigma-70 family)